jgi:hypothetical protein
LDQDVARLDKITFIDADFFHPQRFLSGDIYQIDLDSAIARNDSLREV